MAVTDFTLQLTEHSNSGSSVLSMAEKGKQAHKLRTRLTPRQLRVLRDVSQRTLSPGWATIQDVASETQLEEHVVQVWFKNQRTRRKRIDAEGRRFLSSKEGIGSERDPYFPEDSLKSPPSAPGTSSSLDQGAYLAVDGEHHEGAAASILSPVPDVEPKDPLDNIDLEELRNAPWASLNYNLEEMIQAYHIPGDDDLDSLDQYLLPSGSDSLDSHPLQM